jgi:glycosyltransferase involved in cell wall biosynthesis
VNHRVRAVRVRLRPVRRAWWQLRDAARAIPQRIRLSANTLARMTKVAVASVRNPSVPPRVPLVTVIIATYNWSSVLRYAIESVRRQSYSNWELLVIGDGCTDDSELVAQSFHDARIQWINLPTNTGSQSAPNNAGLSRATGEYVAYHGHDDVWVRDHLVRLVTALDQTGAGIASTVFETIGPPGSNVRIVPYLTDPGIFAHTTTPSSIMHRRDAASVAGPWRDYRELVQPPDVEFIDRVASRFGSVIVPALTACKFNSAMRRDSYVNRRSDEQRLYSERIARERFFVLRELASFLWLWIRQPETHLPRVPEPPGQIPPGWYVTEWRRIRGLEPPLEEPATRGS